jgi:hypothetical protein
MTDYRVLYKNIIYNAVSVGIIVSWNAEECKNELYNIDVTYLDENNRIAIITDNVKEFQFIRK